MRVSLLRKGVQLTRIHPVFKTPQVLSIIKSSMSTDSITTNTDSKSSHNKVTTSPNPDWQPGETQVSPFDAHPHVPIDVVPGSSYYHLLISSIVPRPVAFVSSQSSSGINNLAPFSYCSAVCHDPPTISVGICMTRGGGKKDSWKNIEETGEFVVNIISDWMVESANYTSGDFPFEIDEMEHVGLTPIPSVKVKPNRVKQSAVQMECKMSHVHHIYNDAGDHTCAVVFGRIVMFHVVEPLLRSTARGAPEVNIEGYRPMGRLGGDTWTHLGDRFDISRPAIKK